MKILKINQAITTNAGFDIPAGAVVRVAEALFRPVLTKGNGDVPMQAALDVYASDTAQSGKKRKVNNLLEETEFPLMVELDVPVLNFENTKTETLIVNAVKAKLDLLYPGNVTIVTISVS